MFTYAEDDYLIAFPLLLRPIDGEPYTNATSVYGYGGPIVSDQAVSESVVANFQEALKEAMLGRGVVSVFSTMHPLIEQESLLAGLGESRANAQTVSIDSQAAG